jgi:hypothetical protein
MKAQHHHSRIYKRNCSHQKPDSSTVRLEHLRRKRRRSHLSEQRQSSSEFVGDSENLRGEMPVNMAVEEPRPRVISHKTNRNIISLAADADNVTQYRVVPVIGTVPRTANDIERMTVEMDGMLTRRHTWNSNDMMDQGLTGPPTTPAGIVNSTTSPRLSPYILPAGTRS